MYLGSTVAFRGQVVQAIQNDRDVMLRIDVTEQQYGWTSTVYVEYRRGSEREERILEKDILRFSGTFRGIKSYRSVMGATIQLPFVEAHQVSREPPAPKLPTIIRGPGYWGRGS